MPGLRGEGLPISGRTEAPSLDGAILGARWISANSRMWEILKWVFSFPAMLGTFLIGATFYDARTFMVDTDIWWHIKAGQTILATHGWPTVDAYSSTVHGQPWIAYEWLGDVLMGAVARVGGLRGLDALLIALGGAVMIALYVFGTIRSGNSKAGFVAAAGLISLATPSFTMRPQMLGYLFLVLTLIALELFRQGKQWAIWLLPAMFLAWVNTHGSFIIGLGVILVYLVCGLKEFRVGGIEAKKWTPKQRVRLELLFLLCLAVLPITPYGTRLAVYPFDMAVGQPINVANVVEWHSMPFNLAVGKVFLVLVFGFFAAQMALSLKWRLEELTLFLGGVAMACVHFRFLLLFVPFFTPLLATVAARWLPRYDARKNKYILNAVLMAGVIAGMVHYFPSPAFLDEKVAENFPAKAVDYLREHPTPGPMFNDYGFGGYLVWSGQKVFIDGRGDLYERGGVLSDYLQVVQVRPAALAVLRNYGIQSCLIERDAPLATLLRVSTEWRELYSDSTSVLFVRQKTGEAAVQKR
jgi:hypothetical protein